MVTEYMNALMHIWIGHGMCVAMCGSIYTILLNAMIGKLRSICLSPKDDRPLVIQPTLPAYICPVSHKITILSPYIHSHTHFHPDHRFSMELNTYIYIHSGPDESNIILSRTSRAHHIVKPTHVHTIIETRSRRAERRPRKLRSCGKTKTTP